MGLANGNSVHKQDNFFLFFPMYVCLGVYYVLRTFASPVIWIWNKSSDTLYTTVNKNVDANNLRGAYMTEADKIAAEEEAQKSMLEKNNAKRQVKISESLIKARENLINAIDSGEEQRSEIPITYRYTALGPDGKQVTNAFYAFSKIEVYTFLENEGYKVFKIETSPLIERLYGNSIISSRKIRIKDIVFWLQQLSTYLKSGIPLTDAMRILSKQMGKKNGNIKRTFDSVVYNLTLGESFSTSLEKQGDAFPSLLINMIKSAEATGDLEGTLDEMADYYKATETTRKEMISALTYPCLVFVFSIAVIIFILIYLIPKFVDIYNTAGVTLNPITTFIIKASEFMQDNLLYIGIVFIIFMTIIIVLYKNIKAFRYFMQTVFMKIPVMGSVIIYKEMMIFTKTFASLLRNNVFITDSMDILGKITSNEIYREIMINTINYIGRGEKISSAFQGHWAIPEVAYYMMVTGESTGELAEMMGKVSDYYAEQHKMVVDSLKTLIEPILIIFLAVVVGGIMIAVIVPMFGLYQEIIS
ncbi:MAG: type II secretion system F family protein [Erysipelotrichales bacterium]|nr:type II secretion system F family protein [Erysipelotrichales bacterium]